MCGYDREDFDARRAGQASGALTVGLPAAALLLLPVSAPNESETVALALPRLDRTVEVLLGLAALLVVAWGLRALHDLPRPRTAFRSVRVAVPLAGAGLYAVFTLWAMAQPTHGANMGAGMIFLTACVVVPALLGTAAWAAWRRPPY